ncbi:MAG: hypothetical protein AAGF11_48630 [Myxococcota bacterium]
MSALIGGAYWAALALAVQVVTPTEGVDLRSTLTEPQQAWWDLDPEARKKGLLCGRRSGKSELLARWLTDKAKDAAEDFYAGYASVTRKSAAEAMWPVFKRVARLTGRPHAVNEAALMITFAGGGSILLGGMETVRDVERWRGKKYAAFAFDECGALRDSLLRRGYTEVIEPACMDCNGWIGFGGTPGYYPKGKWWELTRDGAEHETGIPIRRWNARQNPYVLDADGYFERIKRENGWTDETPIFVREYLGRWVRDLGQLVFPVVRGRNTIAQLPTHNAEGLVLVREGWRYVLGLDIGVRHPTAISVLAAHQDLAHRRFVLSAEKRSQWLVQEYGARLHALRDEYEVEGRKPPVVCDTGGMGALAAQELSRVHGLPIERADKSDKLASVYFARDGLISGQIQVIDTGPADPLLDEWDSIQWSETNPGEPEDGDDHCSDATRYGLPRLHHYVQEDPRPTKVKTLSELAAEEMRSMKAETLRKADERARRENRDALRRLRAAARRARR